MFDAATPKTVSPGSQLYDTPVYPAFLFPFSHPLPVSCSFLSFLFFLFWATSGREEEVKGRHIVYLACLGGEGCCCRRR